MAVDPGDSGTRAAKRAPRKVEGAKTSAAAGATSAGEPASQSVHEQIVASLTSGVIAVDKDAVILTLNPAASLYLNVPAESLHAGMALGECPPAEQFLDLFHELQRGARPIHRREIEFEVNGVRRMLGVTASALQGPDSFNGVIFLFTDLSDVRNLERRAELNRQLAQIGELTAGVVHELRNPMSVISGMAELLIRRLGPEHQQTRQAEMIFQEAQQIEKLISQFLSFAKPFEAKLARCSAEAVAERALQLVERAANEKGVRLEARIEPGLPPFQADLYKLAQALGNLMRNAVEAIRGEDGLVCLIASLDESQIGFRVEDNGPGIHLNPGEDLLNPFFSKKEGGTGLGLSIVHRIITAHGGTIRYANRPEGGAAFEITLPIEYGK